MSIHCFIDRSHSIVFTTLCGAVSFAQIERHAKRLVSNPNFEPTFSQIIDLRELSKSDVAFHQMNQFAKDCDPFSEASRRALLTSTDFAFGMARMYQGLRGDPDNCMFFRDMTSARRWLGLDH